MSTFESSFPPDFRAKDIAAILRFATIGKFCQLICLPGEGKATLLKLLGENSQIRKFHLGQKENLTRFVYLNLLELVSFDQPTIDKFLLLSLKENTQIASDPLVLSKQLKELITSLTAQTALIFLFDHFDEFQNQLPRSFFQTLRSLKNLGRFKFACVLATRRDLRQLVDLEILREFYDFFVGNTVYMKLNDQPAIDFLFTQIENVIGKKLSRQQKNQIISLTAGHTKLTKVTTEAVLQENVPLEKETLLKKPMITACLFELWLFLTAQEQKVLSNIVTNTPVMHDEAVENLINFGLLTQPSNLTFTIPLFQEFVRVTIPTLAVKNIAYNHQTREITKGDEVVSGLLSPQENRLLKFLIENQGRIINREELIPAVWPQAQVTEGISDEAIDQMIFRLRKKIEDEPTNPKHILTVKGQGFRFQP